MNYYYLAASLPTVTLDDPPWMSYARFRALCAVHLSRTDLNGQDEMEQPPEGVACHRFAGAWRERETALRNAVTKIRARRLQRDAAGFVREASERSDAEHAAADAFARPSPLDREMALDRFRWAQIEELAGLNPFSSEAVLAYGLKLRLAERWAALREEDGRKKAEEIVRRPPSANETPGEQK